MKLTRRIRIFFNFYVWVVLGIGAVVYFDAFNEMSVFVNTELVNMLSLRGEELRVLPWQYIFGLCVLVALSPSLYFLRTHIRRAPSLVLATACFLLILTVGLVLSQKIILPFLYLELSLLSGTAIAIILKMIFAANEQQFLRLAFSQFVSEEMLKELLKDPDKLKLQGKEAELTLMFLDIRGFTTFSEKNPPALVVHRLNDLLDKVTHIILDNGGTVDKYMGDAVMAMWGAPALDKKQASRALTAAMQIRDVILTQTEFKVGIGINYGHAIVGNMGSTRRFDYTAIGDTVNTAARLESATKELGETIVLSDSVRQRLEFEKTELPLKDLGVINVKGKTTGIHVYSVQETVHKIPNINFQVNDHSQPSPDSQALSR